LLAEHILTPVPLWLSTKKYSKTCKHRVGEQQDDMGKDRKHAGKREEKSAKHVKPTGMKRRVCQVC
jgi:hypothetical protein